MDKRTILAIVLALAVLIAYQVFFAKPPVPQKAAAPQQSAQQAKKDATAPSGAAPAQTAALTRPAPKAAATKPEAAPRDISVETPYYSAIFSTRGAALKSLKLKAYHQDCYECTDDVWPKIKAIS